jgi:hypothetical protein
VAKRAKFQIPTNKTEKEIFADKLMNELTELIEKPTTTNQPYKSWISDSTFKIVYAKGESRRKGNTEVIGPLTKELRKVLKLIGKTECRKLL